MILYPAIDLKGGQCVRLVRGEMADATVFSDDPPAQAQSFAAALGSDGKLAPDFEDEILVGAPQGDAFHVPGMGGVLVAHAGEIHAAQSRLQVALG